MNIIIEIKPTETTMNTYMFYVNRDFQMMLDDYYESQRESKRHSYRIGRKWSRLMGRDCTMNKPDVPDEVIQQALEKARERLYYV